MSHLIRYTCLFVVLTVPFIQSYSYSNSYAKSSPINHNNYNNANVKNQVKPSTDDPKAQEEPRHPQMQTHHQAVFICQPIGTNLLLAKVAELLHSNASSTSPLKQTKFPFPIGLPTPGSFVAESSMFMNEATTSKPGSFYYVMDSIAPDPNVMFSQQSSFQKPQNLAKSFQNQLQQQQPQQQPQQYQPQHPIGNQQFQQQQQHSQPLSQTSYAAFQPQDDPNKPYHYANSYQNQAQQQQQQQPQYYKRSQPSVYSVISQSELQNDQPLKSKNVRHLYQDTPLSNHQTSSKRSSGTADVSFASTNNQIDSLTYASRKFTVKRRAQPIEKNIEGAQSGETNELYTPPLAFIRLHDEDFQEVPIQNTNRYGKT